MRTNFLRLSLYKNKNVKHHYHYNFLEAETAKIRQNTEAVLPTLDEAKRLEISNKHNEKLKEIG